MKSVTKFSGGGGVDLGMEAAGWDHLYGIEYDDKIASVARNNGLNTITADILGIKPDDYSGMDWMHDSPPCPNFSTAKANGEETENDIALAQAVCDWIVYHRPQFYTLENVYGYRKSKSWAMIADTLHRQGYLFNFWHVNMASFGVPQTRKRMIVIARRDGIMPQLPEPTHAKNPQVGLFETKKRWVSWYDAIEDLIPTLPDYEISKSITDWYHDQKKETLLFQTKDYRCWGDGFRRITEPSFTITTSLVKSIKYTDHFKEGGVGSEMTTRALARFQTFPDTYTLPDSNTLAARIIGNAVPPLFMQRVGEMFADDIRHMTY